MSSPERVNALLAGKPIDRVPLWLLARGFCARCVGYDIASIYNDPEKSFFAQQWTSEMFGVENIPRLSYNQPLTIDWGGEVEFPADVWAQSVVITRYPVNTEGDAWNLEVPDVRSARHLSMIMEFGKISRKFGLPVTINTGTPLNGASFLCGTNSLLRWMIKRPELVHHLLGLITAFYLEVASFWVDTFGVEHLIVLQASPTESNQLISPKHYEEFALPYTKDLNEKLLTMGIKHIFSHICGDQNLNLPSLAQIPMGNDSIVSVGHEVDLETAIRYFGDTCIIAGNVEPAIIQHGSPQEVYDLAKQCIEKAKHAPRGYMLLPGCELPPNAPPYNVYMMKKAVDDFGWYDY